MIWEVEQKFALADAADLRSRLVKLGATFEASVRQVDEYLSHPARDFRATDEAFRLRRDGQNNFVTYKGPKVDQATKTRQEIELPLPAGEATLAEFQMLFDALGFQRAGTVAKTREAAALVWKGHTVHVALDDVEQLGSFVELEIAADDTGLAAARAALESLSQKLDLSQSERRSYLELLRESGTRRA